MAYYSDSSDSYDSDGLEDAINHIIAEEETIRASWAAAGNQEDDESPGEEGPGNAAKLTSRAYQLEMLEASLKENVIVAMDTGSGKTQV